MICNQRDLIFHGLLGCRETRLKYLFAHTYSTGVEISCCVAKRFTRLDNGGDDLVCRKWKHSSSDRSQTRSWQRVGEVGRKRRREGDVQSQNSVRRATSLWVLFVAAVSRSLLSLFERKKRRKKLRQKGLREKG